MSGIKRLNIDWTYQGMDFHPEGELVYFHEHEMETARLRAEVDALRKIISPFAEYERVRSAMGGNSPKEGTLLGVHSSAGSAELSVEDFKAAQTAMGADQ